MDVLTKVERLATAAAAAEARSSRRRGQVPVTT